ncbi:MAG: phenylacetate--CoA ligase family protein [Chloroflexi bacterium]|nr:phenylacetate--CoA ligase family protein [Chloroflexota bacterium]
MVEKRYYKPEIERLSREDFLQYQWQQLQRQIRYTYEKSGLCQRQFRQAKITPDDIKTREDFTCKVPCTTKQDLVADQREKPPFGTRLAVREEEIFATYLTGGTSGKGQEVHTATIADWEHWIDAGAMMYVWAGWQKGERAMNPLPLGVTQASRVLQASLERVGCNVFNLGMYDTRTKLEYMKRFQIGIVDTSPSYIEALAYEAEKLGMAPAKDLFVRKIMMAGQAYPISFIGKTEAKWHAVIYDNYAATQGAWGANCEKGPVIDGKRGFYHLYEHFAYQEIIDPETHKPVRPGEVGELVVTPLHQKASPFLRFRMGDKVRYFPHNACDCGRPFALLEAGTIARYDDMMKVKGVNIWPQTVDEIVLIRPECVEYKGRVFLTDAWKEEIEVSVEFRNTVPSEVRRNLLMHISGELHDRTGIRFSLKEAAGELPRYAMKATSLRWTDERVKGLERKPMDRG